MKELKVGDKIYRYKSERHSDPTIVEHTIHSIGKKYLYIEDYRGGKKDDTPIGKENLRFEDKVYTQHNMQFYRTEQEIKDMLEENHLNRVIKEKFGTYSNARLTLDQLRRINQIINETT